jgi:hypothetical protein
VSGVPAGAFEQLVVAFHRNTSRSRGPRVDELTGEDEELRPLAPDDRHQRTGPHETDSAFGHTKPRVLARDNEVAAGDNCSSTGSRRAPPATIGIRASRTRVKGLGPFEELLMLERVSRRIAREVATDENAEPAPRSADPIWVVLARPRAPTGSDPAATGRRDRIPMRGSIERSLRPSAFS